MIKKQSKSQLQLRIRNTARESKRIFVTGHAEKQMRRRAITRELMEEVLQRGQLRPEPEPNLAYGTLECRMERFCAGRDLGVVVALSDEDPDLVVVTAMVIGD